MAYLVHVLLPICFILIILYHEVDHSNKRFISWHPKEMLDDFEG